MINSENFSDTDTQILAEIQNTLNGEANSNTPWISMPPYLDTKTDLLYQIWQSLMLGGGGGNGGNIVDTLDETLKAGNTSTEDVILQSVSTGNPVIQLFRSGSDTSGRIFVGNKDIANTIDANGDSGVLTAQSFRIVPRSGVSLDIVAPQLTFNPTITIPRDTPEAVNFIATVCGKQADITGNIPLTYQDIAGGSGFRYFEKNFSWLGATAFTEYRIASTLINTVGDEPGRFTFKHFQPTPALLRTVCNFSIYLGGVLQCLVSFKTDFFAQSLPSGPDIDVVNITKKIGLPGCSLGNEFSDRNLLILLKKNEFFYLVLSDVENFFTEIADFLQISMQDANLKIDFTIGVEVQPQFEILP